MMEAASTSETSVNFYQTTRCNVCVCHSFKSHEISDIESSVQNMLFCRIGYDINNLNHNSFLGTVDAA
jgi:hypothetical protein